MHLTPARFSRSLLATALLLAVTRIAYTQERPVSRIEALEIAEAYRNFEWTPTEKNAFHGIDSEGVRVNTPDIAFLNPGSRPGWWIPNQVNVGVPYMWGGFSSLTEFKDGIEKGMYAGDVYTREKRRLLDSAVSRHAVGIDCSGLISRCWKLKRSFSTRELPALCIPLGIYSELKAGDVLNSHNNHVLLFREFTDKTQQRLLAYETGSPPTWKVLLDDIPVSMLQEEGYMPFRFRRITD